MKFRKYVLTVKHDEGKAKIRTVARNKAQARKQVCNAENCPVSSITKTKYAGRVI
jgi:hypothetical protein